MPLEAAIGSAPAARSTAGLRSVLRRLPEGGLERRAIEAGEIDAVIDYGHANVIVFPAARRALREAARRACALDRMAALEMPERNLVLAALPRVECRRLRPALEQVELRPGEVLMEAGAPVRYVHFPVACVVCLLTQTGDRQSVQTGLVGREGVVGSSLALGVGLSSVRAVVQLGGAALRMPAAQFRSELQRGLPLQRLLYRHAQLELDQARQFAACTGSHALEQRLACRLLMIGDRAHSQELFLTQEHLGAVFNVRRVSITLACSSLRARGLISYHRGRISILDRVGLASASCPCYCPIALDEAAGPAPALRLPGTR